MKKSKSPRSRQKLKPGLQQPPKAIDPPLEIRLCKADLFPDQRFFHQDVIIHIGGRYPNLTTLEEAQLFADGQARRIAEVLRDALPQGVIERLMIELMARRVSDYRGTSADQNSPEQCKLRAAIQDYIEKHDNYHGKQFPGSKALDEMTFAYEHLKKLAQ